MGKCAFCDESKRQLEMALAQLHLANTTVELTETACKLVIDGKATMTVKDDRVLFVFPNEDD